MMEGSGKSSCKLSARRRNPLSTIAKPFYELAKGLLEELLRVAATTA